MPARASLRTIRDAVAGRGVGMPRQRAMALLCASDYPNAHRDLGAVLVNPKEPREIQLLAAAQLGRIDSAGAVAILTENAGVADEEIRAVILTSLGRVGTRATLDRLVQASRDDVGLARSAARFGAVLLAHKFRLPGFELAVPSEEEYLEPMRELGFPLRLARADEDVGEYCLRCLAHKPLGIELSERHVYEVPMLRNRRIVLFDRELVGPQALPRLLSGPAFLGVVAAADPETGIYFPRSLVLTSPGAAAGTLDISVCRPRGRLVAAGSAHEEGGRIAFLVRAVAQPGARPMRIEGVLDGGGLSFTHAFASPSRRGKIQAQPWPPAQPA